MKRIGVGIIGCGGAAYNVCKAIDALEGVATVATHDRNELSAQKLAAPRGATVHNSADSLVANPAVDVVYIALPHDLLAPTATTVLDGGKHVLVEKPMGTHAEQVQALGALAAIRDRRLGVFFELRQAASVRAAKRLIGLGAIGEIRAIRIQTVIDKPQSYWSSGPSGYTVDHWRASKAQAGGGVLLMNSSHQLDLVRHITGLEVVRAAGEVATHMAAVEVEDTASATLRYSNGAVGSMAAAAHSFGAIRQEVIEFDGTHGRFNLPDPYGAANAQLYLARQWHDYRAREWIEVAEQQRDSYVAMITEYMEAVRSGADAPVGYRDAQAVLSIVQAIYDSARTGNAVSL